MIRAIPDAAVDLIARFEGFEPVAYICPAGAPTIGYGHTRTVAADEVGVRRITEQEGRELLREDMGRAARALAEVIPQQVAALNEHQYGALVSFVFNCGAAPSWRIWQRIRGGDLDAVPGELRRFVNAGGRRLRGLERRRAEEIALWERPAVIVPQRPIDLPPLEMPPMAEAPEMEQVRIGSPRGLMAMIVAVVLAFFARGRARA